MKILLIEDEEKIAWFIQKVLSDTGHDVTIANSVENALRNRYELNHALIILDLMLPGKSGEFLVSELRKRRNNIPILVLSAQNRISTKIELLNLGADDYMIKPFDAHELIARVNAMYRRYLELPHQDDPIQYGNIIFLFKQNKLIRDNQEITLTKKEGTLLEFLLQNHEQRVSTEDIINKVWKRNTASTSNVLQTTIRRLRKKIDDKFKHKLIHNVHGFGYSLILPKN